MAIKGKRVFYQKAQIYVGGIESNLKLEALLRAAFTQLTTDQRIVVLGDQSEWHLNAVDTDNGNVFLHLIHLKPGYQRSGFRRRGNATDKVVSIGAGVDTEFVQHDICATICGNDVIVYGGIHTDKSLSYYTNGLLLKARIINGTDFIRITNVLKNSTTQEIERHGVESIDLDAVQNSEAIGIGAHQRAGLVGRLINSPLAQHEKIKVWLRIDANGHFKKSRDQIDAELLQTAIELVGGAADEDWDGIKITLKNGVVLKKGAHVVAEDLPISRIGECLNAAEAKPLMYEFYSRLRRSRQLVRD